MAARVNLAGRLFTPLPRHARHLALMMAASTAGCVHYVPQPVDTGSLARAVSNYNASSVEAESHRLTPSADSRPGQWDRLQLFAAARLYNPDVAAARAAIASSEAAASAARVRSGATLTLSSEYALNATEASPWLFGAALDLPLDLGGRRKAALTSVDLAVVAARYDYAEALWKVRMAIQTALVSRLIGERQALELARLAAVRERQFAAVQRRVDAGEAARSDLERVRVDLADAGKRLNEARAQVAAANAGLAAATGVPVAILSVATMTWEGFDDPGPIPPVSADLAIAALVARADVLKAVIAYDVAESDLRGEVAKQFPAISIAPGYTWERGLVKLPFNVGLALPPLDLNRHAIAAAEVRRSEAGTKLEASVASAKAALASARLEAEASRAALSAVQSGELVTATRLAQAADRELRAGAIDRTDWAAAQAGIELARLSEIDALSRVHGADARIEDALRQPLTGPERSIVAAKGE